MSCATLFPVHPVFNSPEPLKRQSDSAVSPHPSQWHPISLKRHNFLVACVSLHRHVKKSKASIQHILTIRTYEIMSAEQISFFFSNKRVSKYLAGKLLLSPLQLFLHSDTVDCDTLHQTEMASQNHMCYSSIICSPTLQTYVHVCYDLLLRSG